jgi:maltose O-acetyltransferase
MILKRIRGLVLRRFKNIIFELAKVAEKDALSQHIERTLRDLKFAGTGIKINGYCDIRHPHNVSIGNNVHIGANAFFHAYGGLIIEDNVHISRNVVIYTYNHRYNGTVLPYDTEMVGKPVHIGKNVWLGMNVSVIPGVSIGEGAIVGIGATVSQNIPPLAIVGSPPVQIIRYRDKVHYEILEKKAAYGGIGGTPLGSDEIQKFKFNPNTD